MSVEITAGPPDIADEHPVSPEVAATVKAAEAVLSRRFGATVRLAEPEDLGGSGRSVVARVKVAATPFSLPRTLVVKHYRNSGALRGRQCDHEELPPEGRAGVPQGSPAGASREALARVGVDAFTREAASCQLFTSMTVEERVGPELVAYDPGERLLVLEDLGRAPTLADKLLGGDARAAERALIGWARSLGRLHATTAGREADFEALARRLGRAGADDPVAAHARVALAELPDLLAGALGVPTPERVAERARRTARLLGVTRYRAFSPSDVCPDNNLVTSRGVRFLDFEWGSVRDIALDAAYLRVPFPSCWCVFALPPGMAEAMVAAWQAEVRVAWPDLTEEAVLPRLLDAQLLWVWVSTWWFLPRAEEPDRPVDAHLPSPRRSIALVDRWERLAVQLRPVCAESAGHAEAVAAALRTRFGLGDQELPLYPAFR
ncbi:phosphotransferase family protein [Streptoalloteichus hindustanus]|uniref:Thiamine kinase n=1 Tax=Streptoalloteichus hindustanus TaxID=2017 RepID=A0A1M5HC70_STRHI|nr:hypothetical protein [Streptoalloteichus hindustanus]SHG13546.1 hypothetical protein SAMN05444320_106500 [Streptoalloteichus hindustanus]